MLQGCLGLYGPLLLSSSLFEAFNASFSTCLLALSGFLVASCLQLDTLGKEAQCIGCISQQVLLFLAGLLSRPDCCPAAATHLAACSAFWLYAHKEVKLWHALSIQTAETAIALGIRLGQMLPGQATAGIMACMAVYYLAIGLVVPAAALCGHGLGVHAALAAATRRNKQRQPQEGHAGLQPIGHSSGSRAEKATQLELSTLLSQRLPDVRTLGSDAAVGSAGSPSSATGPPLCEEVLELLRHLVGTGALNPCLVQQQLDVAVRRAHEDEGVAPAARSSSGSSRYPSTRPSTSFSSSSPLYDAAPVNASGSIGAPLSTTCSSLEFHLPSSDQPHLRHLQQHQPLSPLAAILPVKHVHQDAPCRVAAAHMGPDPCVQQLGRQRPMRSRTAACLGPVSREELPPIVEAAQEDPPPQQALQHVRSSGRLASKWPADQAEHRSWPPVVSGAAGRAAYDCHGTQEQGAGVQVQQAASPACHIKSDDGQVPVACLGEQGGISVTQASPEATSPLQLARPTPPPPCCSTAGHVQLCAALQNPDLFVQQQQQQQGLSSSGALSAQGVVLEGGRAHGPASSEQEVTPLHSSAGSSSQHVTSDSKQQPLSLSHPSAQLSPAQPSLPLSIAPSDTGNSPAPAANGAVPQVLAPCSTDHAGLVGGPVAQAAVAADELVDEQQQAAGLGSHASGSSGSLKGSGLSNSSRQQQSSLKPPQLKQRTEGTNPCHQEGEGSISLWLDQQAYLLDGMHRGAVSKQSSIHQQANSQQDAAGSESHSQKASAPRAAACFTITAAQVEMDQKDLAEASGLTGISFAPKKSTASDLALRLDQPASDTTQNAADPLPHLVSADSSGDAAAQASAAAEALPGNLDAGIQHDAAGEQDKATPAVLLLSRNSSMEHYRVEQGLELCPKGILERSKSVQSQGSSTSFRRVSFAGCPADLPTTGPSPMTSLQPLADLSQHDTSGTRPDECFLQQQQQQKQYDGDRQLGMSFLSSPPALQHPEAEPAGRNCDIQPTGAGLALQMQAGTPSNQFEKRCDEEAEVKQWQPHAFAGATDSSVNARTLNSHLSTAQPGESIQDGADSLPDVHCNIAKTSLGKDAQLPSVSGNPAAQQHYDQRFPTQTPKSSLLQHLLPDSMRANLQGLPAKAGDQSQATAYAGSNHISSKKMRPTGDNTELEVENTIIANRRYLDASKVLLDEIQVNKVLGFGSMGMVYFGVLWDTKVVVKMIEHGAGLLGKEQNRGKLARTEAVLSRMLLHPNVVITYDCCTGMMDASRLQVSGTPSRALRGKAGRQRQMTVMVQEFCDAGTLSDALQKRKYGLDMANPDCPTLVMQLALDIANGIKYMHSLRVLHIDLKAENILLTRSSAGTAPAKNRPGQLTAKVADLGLALVLAVDCDEVQSGIHGTVSHMPPEAMRGTTFSMATDVYSFGVVLWELATQGKPFAGLVAHQVVEAVCDFDERPVWPGDLHPQLAGLKALATQCWDASPSNRPSIFEVVDRLHELIDPSLAAQQCDGANSMATEESDELEIALRSQSKQAAAASQSSGLDITGEHSGSLLAGKEAEAAAHSRHVHAKRQSNESHKRRSCSSKRGSSCSGEVLLGKASGQKQGTGLQAIMAAGPPRDMLSRMLYYLAQVPPLPEHLQRVEVGGGIVRVAGKVDMSGLRVSAR